MEMEFKGNVPIYIQIVDMIKGQIISNKWLPGSKTPSVRDLASMYSVNPNTMQRALSELEQIGLLKTERTMGRRVTEDKEMINELREDMASKEISEFLKRMENLGFDKEQVINIIKRGGEVDENSNQN